MTYLQYSRSVLFSSGNYITINLQTLGSLTGTGSGSATGTGSGGTSGTGGYSPVAQPGRIITGYGPVSGELAALFGEEVCFSFCLFAKCSFGFESDLNR